MKWRKYPDEKPDEGQEILIYVGKKNDWMFYGIYRIQTNGISKVENEIGTSYEALNMDLINPYWILIEDLRSTLPKEDK